MGFRAKEQQKEELILIIAAGVTELSRFGERRRNEGNNRQGLSGWRR